MRDALRFVCLLVVGGLLHAQPVKNTPKPEMRLFLRESCIVSPLPEVAQYQQRLAAKGVFGGLAGIFAPKIIEAAIGGLGTLLKKAGADETEQTSASENANFYLTDNDQKLNINPNLGCLLAAYGIFADKDGKPTDEKDEALRRLEKAQLIPPNADILVVLEAAVIPMPDHTAMYLDARHFSVRDFIGDRKKNERSYIATLAVTVPKASAEGETIALGHLDFGRIVRETVWIGDFDKFPRYRSNLMPWRQISEESLKAYTEDVKRNKAQTRPYMPVTFTLTLSETADGNKFLVKLGELLEAAKGDVAKELSKAILPEEIKKAAQEAEISAEKLIAAEEDAHIAVLKAQAALADKPGDKILQAELEKAQRALERATRLRKAAGLPDPKWD